MTWLARAFVTLLIALAGVLGPATPANGSGEISGPSRAIHGVAEAKAFAHHRVSSSRQWRCLDRLWTQESRWQRKAVNAKTGAAGIPQGMHTHYGFNAKRQIRWGFRYIEHRYGSMCVAERHELAEGWY